MSYIPQTETDTLLVQLGFVKTLNWTAGSNSFTCAPSDLTSADVDSVIMVLSGGTDGLTNVTWTTIATVTASNAGTTADALPDGNSTHFNNAVLYRPMNGPTNYPATGSVEVDLSITNRSTAQFVLISRDGSFIPAVGTPVLITDTEVGIDYFGGTIDQNQVTNEPGAPLVYSQCQCTGWEIICNRRTTGTSDAVAENDATYGATNPSIGTFFNLRPDQIISYYVKHALFNDGVTTNLDTTGPVLPTFSSIAAKVSDALDQLVSAATPTSAQPQYQWFMSPRRVLNFIKIHSLVAPWNISDADLSDQNVLIQVQNTVSRQNYFNRGLCEITKISQTFFGSQLPTPGTTFFLAQTIPASATGQVSISVLYANTPGFGYVSQSVGIGGLDIQKQWYYLPGTPNLAQQTFINRGAWNSTTTYVIGDYVQFGGQNYSATSNGNKNKRPDLSAAGGTDWRLGTTLGPNDVIVVNFPVDVIFVYDASDAEATQQQTESGSGLWEAKINTNALNTVADAETFVTSMVEQAKTYSQQIQIDTYKPGLNIGETIQINLKDIGVDSQGSPALGAYFLIDSIKIRTEGNRKHFTVTASIDAPIVGTWVAQLQRGLGMAGGMNAHPLSVPPSGSAVVISGSGGSGSSAATQTPLASLETARAWVDENTREPAATSPLSAIGAPIRYNGYLYLPAPCNDGTFQVFKSTDHGRTWTALDTTHAPADLSSPTAGGLTGSGVFDGVYTLHCAVVQPNAGKKITLQDFNLATEKWGSAYDGGTTPIANLVRSVFWRPSNNSIFVTYDVGPVDPSPSKSRLWGVSWSFTSASVGTPLDVGAALLTASSSATGDVNTALSSGVVDPNGRLHMLLTNGAFTYFWYQAVELADTAGNSEFFCKPGAGQIQSYILNSNPVISQTRVCAIVITKDTQGSPAGAAYNYRLLASNNLGPGANTDADWTLGGVTL